jgi:hypothetical protein
MDRLREDIHGEEDILTWRQNFRFRIRYTLTTPRRIVPMRRMRRSMPLDRAFERMKIDDED